MPMSMKGTRYRFYLRRRAEQLQVQIMKESPDALICMNDNDSYVLTKDLGCLKIFSCSSPWIDEMYFGGQLSRADYHKLRELELEIYKNADYLSFHWESYTNYVRRNIYDGSNIFIMNCGCSPKTNRAKWANHPRIVFIGYLKGYWNNIPLLAKLGHEYDIDVFGGPAPAPDLGLNYKGYAPSTDILADYQFGLITISKDRLRQNSFSSKHLQYLSYGLPVLTPDWRKDHLLETASIGYNETTFLERIGDYSDLEKWESMSEKCYQQSLKWTWEIQLQPLLRILEKELG
jgi:hypothetical protein